MNVNELLDVKTKRKIDFLEEVYQADNHIVTKKVLLETLNVTEKTLIQIFQAINHDLEQFNLVDRTQLIYFKSKQLISFSIQPSFSFQLLKNQYIKESLRFKILKRLLLKKDRTLNDLADSLFVSYSTVRREISALNIFLEDYEIKIRPQKDGLIINGHELSIRIMYTYLFSNIYGMSHWPKEFINQHEVTSILDLIPKIIFNSRFTDKTMVAYYFCAIHILREPQIKNLSFNFSEDELFYSPVSKEEHEQLDRMVSLFSKRALYLESNPVYSCRFLISCIIVIGPYSYISKIPECLLENQILRKTNTINSNHHFISKLNCSLITKLTKSEEQKLLYCFTIIHYRMLLFNTVPPAIEKVLPNYSLHMQHDEKKFLLKHYQKQISRLIHLCLSRNLEPFRAYIEKSYLITLDTQLSILTQTPQINVHCVSITSNDVLYKNIHNYFSPRFNLKKCVTFSENCEIIITDHYISKNSIFSEKLKLSNSVTIVYIDSYLSAYDYKKILKAFRSIANNKLSLDES